MAITKNNAAHTITRSDLAEAVYNSVGLSQRAAADLVDSVLEELSLAIVNDGEMKISSFGNFSVRQKAERMGRNPKTGEPAVISARKVLTFKPSHILRDALNAEG